MKSIFVAITTLLSTSAMAAPVVYECQNYEYDQTLTIEGEQMSVTSKNDGVNLVAQLDSSYKPRGDAKKMRFKGEENGYNVAVIIYSPMATGAVKKGFIQIRGNQDSYWSTNLECIKQ